MPPNNAVPAGFPFTMHPAATAFPVALAHNTSNQPFVLVQSGQTPATVCTPSALGDLLSGLPRALGQQLEQLSLEAVPCLEDEFRRLAQAASREADFAVRRRSQVDLGLYQEARNAARAKIALPKFKPRERVSTATPSRAAATARAPPPAGRDLVVRLSFNGFPPTSFVERVRPEDTLGALLAALVNRKGLLSKEEARGATFRAGARVLDALDPLQAVFAAGGALDVAVGDAARLAAVALAPPELLPRLGASDLAIEPDLQALARLSEEQLAAVEGFSAANRHARVDFLEAVDLRGAQLDRVLRLGHRSVELYPAGTAKPPAGRGLNGPARITYFDFGFPSAERREEFSRKLAAFAEGMRAEVLEEAPEAQRLVISVRSF